MKYILAILLTLGSFVGLAEAHGPRRYPPRRYDPPRYGYGFYYGHPHYGYGYYGRWDYYPRHPRHRPHWWR